MENNWADDKFYKRSKQVAKKNVVESVQKSSFYRVARDASLMQDDSSHVRALQIRETPVQRSWRKRTFGYI